MKYDRIGLNGIIDPNLDRNYGLIKNKNVEENEEIKYQIIREREKIGTVIIKQKDKIYVTLKIDDNKIERYEESRQIINSIIEIIKSLFYNYPYIYFHIVSKYRLFINSNDIVYTNEKNKIMKELLSEMSGIKENLEKWDISWTEEISKPKLIPYFDDEIEEQYKTNNLLVPEVLIKSNSIIWKNNESNDKLIIEFFKDGYVSFDKTTDNKNHYYFLYNLLDDTFELKKIDSQNLRILKNKMYTIIENDSIKEIHEDDKSQRRIKYITHPIERTSEVTELFLQNGIIKRCNLDFRTHKATGKITGTYSLKILSRYGRKLLSLSFITRNGIREKDFSSELLDANPKLYYELKNDHLTKGLLNEIIETAIPIINKNAEENKRPYIYNNDIIGKLGNAEEEALTLMKEIKGEIPGPNLEEKIDEFTTKYDKSKEKTKINSN